MNLEDLKSRAEKGDAEAQYALAAELNMAGRTEEARQWLTRAAKSGSPGALFTLSAAKLAGAGGEERDPKSAVEGLERAASFGQHGANRLLAALHAAGFSVKRDWAQALTYLQRAFDAGDAIAQREAAMLALMSDPEDSGAGALINSVAKQDGVAAALCVRRALLGRAGASAAIARHVLPMLEAANHSMAANFRQLMNNFQLTGDERSEKEPSPREFSFGKLAALSIDAPCDREKLSDRPAISIVRGAFTPEECDYLIGVATPRLARAEIVDDKNVARIDPSRTAWGASFLPGSLDMPIVKLHEKLAMIAEVPVVHAESLTVLRYLPGEQYRPHHDFLADNENDLKRRGQRVRTALIYLNDGYEGGETHFLSLDMKIKGAPGDVLIFDNIDADGAPDVSALHAGAPVARGEKWLASLWIRDRPYAP